MTAQSTQVVLAAVLVVLCVLLAWALSRRRPAAPDTFNAACPGLPADATFGCGYQPPGGTTPSWGAPGAPAAVPDLAIPPRARARHECWAFRRPFASPPTM